MQSIHKININNILTDYQKRLLPIEIWDIIEKMTEINVAIIYEKVRQGIIKVKLINIYSNDIVREILIDNCDNNNYSDNEIKLSSDCKSLVYLDINNNMIYYDIDTNMTESIKIIKSNCRPRYYFFDRNGLYFALSGVDETYVFDIKNQLLLHKFDYPLHYIKISDDYNKILCCSSLDQIHLYDFKTGDRLFFMDLHHLSFININGSADSIIHDEMGSKIKILENNKLKFEYNYDDNEFFLIKGFAFYPNKCSELLALCFTYYIKIINMKNNEIKIIDDIEPCDDIYDIEFTNDGKHLILRKDHSNIYIKNNEYNLIKKSG